MGSDTGPLSRYDSDGNLVWTLPLASEVNAMVLDPHNNRFISLVDGTVARLGGETLSAPNVDTPPQSQTTLVGSNVLFSVAASGFTPLRYKWFFNGTLLTQATNSMLGLTGVTTTNAGLYAVAVSNIVGSVTSAPAQLRVKYVELFQGNQPMTNGNYFFASPPTLTILSAFSNGASFYTLDGSVPSFSSIHYTGPFTVSASATVRAIGYSADFTQSEEADPINVTVQTQHRLTAVATGGGSVTLEPPGGVYANTNHVTATAASTPGWSFLYWLGDASGSVSNLAVSMERDKTIEAVFGTTLSTTVSGNGVIELDPPGGTYQYGAVVRLTGLPQAGSYFGFWGNAVSGNNNPLYLTLTNPAPTVSSIFGTLGSGQVTLTVLISGAGKISVTPQANTYATGTMVTLTATAKGGQTFLHWSGDATGAQNPLTATLDQSKTITANFTGEPVLRVNRPGLEGLTSAGFRFTIVSAPLLAWQILSSSDLNTWTPLGTVTNTEGEAQFTDPAALGYAHYFYKVVPWP